MAIIKSQIKRNKQNEKRRLRNKSLRSETSTLTKAAIAAASTGSDNTEQMLNTALRCLDKAAAKGVLHKNAAARRKSRLVKRVRELTAGTS
ncbi:MAG: 30S ribosomal protein S20 [Acidimicrobiaceae bacterium]|nr:30S ribosomal protein S20 [Acidimicrobiaceae bacterium]